MLLNRGGREGKNGSQHDGIHRVRLIGRSPIDNASRWVLNRRRKTCLIKFQQKGEGRCCRPTRNSRWWNSWNEDSFPWKLMHYVTILENVLVQTRFSIVLRIAKIAVRILYVHAGRSSKQRVFRKWHLLSNQVFSAVAENAFPLPPSLWNSVTLHTWYMKHTASDGIRWHDTQPTTVPWNHASWSGDPPRPLPSFVTLLSSEARFLPRVIYWPKPWVFHPVAPRCGDWLGVAKAGHFIDCAPSAAPLFSR